MNSPARELRTTSTPSPPVIRITSSANSSERESITCCDALLLEECPLLRRPGRGEDLGTDVLRDLQRRLADAAGRGMNQDTLALAQPAEMMQRVVGGHERERDRDRLFEGDVRWLARDQRRVGRHVRAKTRRRQGNDIVANPQVLDARAGSDHGSRALPPEVE